MSRKTLVVALAPVAPLCYSSRGQWIEHLKHAAAEQRDGHAPGPLLIVKGQPVRFNPAYRFCKDCTAQHSLAMTKEGRCKPDYLIDLFKLKTEVKEGVNG